MERCLACEAVVIGGARLRIFLNGCQGGCPVPIYRGQPLKVAEPRPSVCPGLWFSRIATL